MNDLNKPVILHPTDFSDGCEAAFYHAMKLALLKNTALYILHVNHDGENGAHWNEFPNIRETLNRWGMVDPVVQLDELFDSIGIFVDKVEIRGEGVVDAVLRFDHIHRRGIDMLVTSTGARQGMPRWLHPSIAERLARDLNVPTLFVTDKSRQWVAGDTGSIDIDNILVPVDQEVEPQLAVDNARGLLHLFGVKGTITVLHVGTDFDFNSLNLEDDDWCRFNSVVGSGDIVESIANTASVLESDVVLMTTQGHDNLLDTLRGSLSERVLRKAPCTVMVIPTSATTTQT